MDVELSLCSPTLPHVQQSKTSRRLRVSLVTLDLLHSLIRRPEVNDRAQVSVRLHIQHLDSEITRIFRSRNVAQREPLTLQEIFQTRNEARRVSCDPSPCSYDVKLWPCCRCEKPTSTQCPTLLPSVACTASEGISLSFCRRHCRRSVCSAVSDDSAASKLRDTSRRGPSTHLISRPITVMCNVSTSFQGSNFNVQSRVPMRSLQMRFALCMSRAEEFPTPMAHSLTQN